MRSPVDYATKTLDGTTTFVAIWDGIPGQKMRKTRSVSELLAEGKAALERLRSGSETAGRTLAALQRALPEDVASHVFAASLDGDGVLTVLVDSGAFATRLRYLLPGLTPGLAAALGSPIARASVRVRPRG